MDGLSSPTPAETERIPREAGPIPLIAMILSIIGLILFPPLALIGLIMAAISLGRGIPAGTNDRVFAIVAIVVGALAIVVTIIAAIIFFAISRL